MGNIKIENTNKWLIDSKLKISYNLIRKVVKEHILNALKVVAHKKSL